MTPYAEVIGDPIAHSKSPLIHGFWLERLGLAGAYRAAHVRPGELAGYFAARAADPAWRGCNITVPHKQAALAQVGSVSGEAAAIGAINLVHRAPAGGLVGANTDAEGFATPLAATDLAGAPIVVIGAGGAARAVLFALAKRGVGPVAILNRTPDKAAALLAQFGLAGDALPLSAPLPPARLLVNTSTLGMVGQPPLAIDLAPLPVGAVVYDIVYAPLETPLLAAARARGLRGIDGLEMLIGQAAAAFAALFGVAPPRTADAALRARLAA
jgi:shikimate dehydrogenase